MPVELRFSVKVTLPHPTIRGRPARSRGTTCKCSIFSFIYIFVSGLISPELGLPTHLRAVKQQCDKSCARFHIYIPQTYPGINHLNSIFPAAAVSLCDGCETADRAACRMQESAERQQEREALSQPQWTHRLCVQSRELLKGCFTAGVLQVCSIFIKVSLSAFVDEFTTHTDAERRPASLLSDAFEGSLLCSLQPAIQVLHPPCHVCVSFVFMCVCRLAEMESQNCSFFTDSLSPDESLWVCRHLHPPSIPSWRWQRIFPSASVCLCSRSGLCMCLCVRATAGKEYHIFWTVPSECKLHQSKNASWRRKKHSFFFGGGGYFTKPEAKNRHFILKGEE